MELDNLDQKAKESCETIRDLILKRDSLTDEEEIKTLEVEVEWELATLINLTLDKLKYFKNSQEVKLYEEIDAAVHKYYMSDKVVYLDAIEESTYIAKVSISSALNVNNFLMNSAASNGCKYMHRVSTYNIDKLIENNPISEDLKSHKLEKSYVILEDLFRKNTIVLKVDNLQIDIMNSDRIGFSVIHPIITVFNKLTSYYNPVSYIVLKEE